MATMLARLRRVGAPLTLGVFGLLWIAAIATGVRDQPYDWLFDWNVYHTAALDLAGRSLYYTGLAQPGVNIPISDFNYPPLAAAWAVPLLPLGREFGGVIWLLACGASVIAAGLAGAHILRIAAVWVGLAMLLYTRFYAFVPDVMLANDNHIMLGLVAGFAWAFVNRHERTAGILLALAIGTKLWPVALLALLLRERRWTTLRWTLGLLGLQVLASLSWLGIGVLGPMWDAVFGLNLPRDDAVAVPVLWTTWLRVTFDWWPLWGGYAVAAFLILMPTRGRLGLGFGILAGLALNTNLWHHYLLTLAFGLALAVSGLLEMRRTLRDRGRTVPLGPSQPTWGLGTPAQVPSHAVEFRVRQDFD